MLFKMDERSNKRMNGELLSLKHEKTGTKNKVHWLKSVTGL